MKRYKPTIEFRILMNLFGVGMFILPLATLPNWYNDATLSHWVGAATGILVGPLLVYIFNSVEVLIDHDKIELLPRLWRPQVLSWSEVESVVTVFLERGSLRLVPKRHTGKKPLHIELFGMSIDLVRDIITHVPPETRIYLDTRMKRKLAGQPTLFYPIIGKGHLLTREQALNLWRSPRVG